MGELYRGQKAAVRIAGVLSDWFSISKGVRQGCVLKRDFFRVFNPVWDKSMTVGNAQGAFRGTGLFPLNIKAIPDHAFDPSTTTERELPENIVSTDEQVIDSGSSSGNLNAFSVGTDIIIDWSNSTGSTVVSDPLSGNDIVVQWCTATDMAAIQPGLAAANVLNDSMSNVTTAASDGTNVMTDILTSTTVPVSPTSISGDEVISDASASNSVHVVDNNMLIDEVSAAAPSVSLPSCDVGKVSSTVINNVTDISTNEELSDDTVSTRLSEFNASINQPLSNPVKVSFAEILPLPKRTRAATSKRPRPKPPSYELTGTASMQFVSERTKTKNKKTKIDQKQKSKENKSVEKNEAKKHSTCSRKKSTRARTVDVVPCALCKVRRCDDEYPRSWTQCQSCLQWFHNECQGLEENERVHRFLCVECDASD